jgi:hypothetical protein
MKKAVLSVMPAVLVNANEYITYEGRYLINGELYKL